MAAAAATKRTDPDVKLLANLLLGKETPPPSDVAAEIHHKHVLKVKDIALLLLKDPARTAAVEVYASKSAEELAATPAKKVKRADQMAESLNKEAKFPVSVKTLNDVPSVWMFQLFRKAYGKEISNELISQLCTGSTAHLKHIVQYLTGLPPSFAITGEMLVKDTLARFLLKAVNERKLLRKGPGFFHGAIVAGKPVFRDPHCVYTVIRASGGSDGGQQAPDRIRDNITGQVHVLQEPFPAGKEIQDNYSHSSAHVVLFSNKVAVARLFGSSGVKESKKVASLDSSAWLETAKEQKRAAEVVVDADAVAAARRKRQRPPPPAAPLAAPLTAA